MKYIYYVIGILLISSCIVLWSNLARANLNFVRAQYAGAVRCYKVGQEPKSILVKNKRYFSSFEECDNTIGHAI